MNKIDAQKLILEYSVKNVRVNGTKRRNGFTANVYRKNKKIGTVELTFTGEVIQKFSEDEYDRMIEMSYILFPESSTIDFIIKMVDAYIENAELKKQCKKITVLKFKTNKAGEYSTFPTKYTPELKERLHKIFGGNLLEIINERFQ
jgi:hypothetical protein